MKITGAEKGGGYLLSQQDILNEISKCLDLWKKKYGVKRIGLFGSYSRGGTKGIK